MDKLPITSSLYKKAAMDNLHPSGHIVYRFYCCYTAPLVLYHMKAEDVRYYNIVYKYPMVILWVNIRKA
jgi:hypothetical protein